MVKLEQALEIIIEANPDMVITSVVEYEDFYGFGLDFPEDVGKIPAPGGGLDTVIKSNGEISFFSPTEDLDLFFSGIDRMKEAEEILKSKGKENLIVTEIEYEKPSKYIEI